MGAELKGKWHLDELVGAGATAAVYGATHRNGNRVAIKVLHRHYANNPDVRKRFLDEAYIANKIRHPGTVTVHDDDVTDDGCPFLVLDLLKGQSLWDMLEESYDPLATGAVLAIVDQILETLGSAHRAGIIHRDVKPENFFVTTDGLMKLLDFGLAQRDDRGPGRRMTLKGVAMGTPAFMPPEQARGEWDEVDAQTDVWAVGASMFYMLTLQPVHDVESLSEMMVAAGTQTAVPIGAVAPEIPLVVQRIVDRALAFDKRDRFPDAELMRRAVRAAMAEINEPCNVPLSRVTVRPAFGHVSVEAVTIPQTAAKKVASNPPAHYSEPPRLFSPTRERKARVERRRGWATPWASPVNRDRLGALAPRWEQLSKKLLKGARILVVDLDASARAVLQETLQTEGFTVDVVATAQAARLRLGENRYDLVLLDADVQNESDVDLLSEIRAMARELPVALITARASAASIDDALGAGAVDYISKPFRDLGHLSRRLSSIIHRRILALVYDVMIDDLLELADELGKSAPDVEQLLAQVGDSLSTRPDVLALRGAAHEAIVTATLEAADLNVVVAPTSKELVEMVRGDDAPLVFVIDLDTAGAQFLIRDVKRSDPLIEVLVVTEESSVEACLRAMSAGASDFVMSREGGALLTSRAERLADKARNRRTVIAVVRELYRIASDGDSEAAERVLNAVPPEERSIIQAQ